MEKTDILIVGVCILLLFFWLSRMQTSAPLPPVTAPVESTSITPDRTNGQGSQSGQATGVERAEAAGITAAPIIPEEYRDLPPAATVDFVIAGGDDHNDRSRPWWRDRRCS